MPSSATTAARIARIREASERIANPEVIDAQLEGLTGDQKTVLWKLYRASRSDLTAAEMAQRRELVGLFQKTARDIEGDIFQTFRSLGGENWDYNLVRRIGRDKQLLDQVNDRIKTLGGEIKGQLSDGLVDQFKNTWIDSAYRLDSLTPESVAIKTGLLPDREIAAIIGESWNGAKFSERLGLITDDMAHRVRQEIVKSMMAEESWSDTARRIRDEMGSSGQKSVWRAEMIARTELARAQTTANSMLYDENSDVIEKVIWVAHPGACPICKRKHGKSVEVVGYPPEDSHPNCVCDILAVPKTWDGLAKPKDDDFSIKPQSRDSWISDNGMTDRVE